MVNKLFLVDDFMFSSIIIYIFFQIYIYQKNSQCQCHSYYSYLRNQMQLDYTPTIFSEPYLYKPEADLFYEYLNKSKIYFEFGSGGTTQQAIKRKLKIYVAETHQSWIDQMKTDVQEIKNKIKKTSIYSFPIDINYLLVDIDSGPNMPYKKAQKYVRLYNHSKYKADFICVNGKLKFAVIMNLFNQVDQNTTIFVNELENSDHINNITKYFDVLGTNWKSFVIRKKQNIIKMSTEELCFYENEDILVHGRNRKNLNFLRSNFNDIIEKYRYMDDSKVVQTPVYKIWVMWWAGEQNMTNIGKICLERMKRNFKIGTVTLITSQNYDQFVKIPDHIIQLLKSKKITIVCFSDILRVFLVRTQGGLWLDSTIFTANEIGADLFDYSFYTVRGRIGFFVHNGKWNMYLLASKINSVATMFVADMFDAYFKKFEHIFNHFIIDYLFLFGYEYIPIVRRILQKIPPNNENVLWLLSHINDAYDFKRYEILAKNNIFFKLSNNEKFFLLDSNNKTTFYGNLVKEYL